MGRRIRVLRSFEGINSVSGLQNTLICHVSHVDSHIYPALQIEQRPPFACQGKRTPGKNPWALWPKKKELNLYLYFKEPA